MMAKRFGKLPSEILNIEDEYTAFCFDEACVYIMCELESGKTPCYIEVGKEEPKHYSNFKDFYKSYGGLIDGT